MSTKPFQITDESELIEAFWANNPGLSEKKIRSHDGQAMMYTCDTRCAFVDFVDQMQRNGQISDELAQNATLCD